MTELTPDEVLDVLEGLARKLAEQPTFELPNPRDRARWEAEQRRRPDNQRELFA